VSGFSLFPQGITAAATEGLGEHTTRLGPLPPARSDFIDVLERSGLRGRGGAAFPVGTKWRTVAGQRGRAPVVLVNGAEGEPLSHKDRRLMETRPHLILDGAAIAARAIGAAKIVYYIGAEHRSALSALQRGLAERPAQEQRHSLLVTAPAQYVAGEESAAVHFVNDGIALPTAIPPRPFVRGVDDRPTLVQNVETLAHVAMIARHGDAWFRGLGEGASAGTALITVSGAVPASSVIEVAQGTTIRDAVRLAGGVVGDTGAVLLGGYFGGWIDADEAWTLRLDAESLKLQGRSLGCGVVGVLPAGACGVTTTARVMSYLAEESARQCGPCIFGLRAIAAATTRIAALDARSGDLESIERWTGQLPGRGACHHPDGAAGFLQSALRVFADEFALHCRHRRCGSGDELRVAA
jgi:NADH:ubiquinone oxidoreductase subunit F (NADH-binding)